MNLLTHALCQILKYFCQSLVCTIHINSRERITSDVDIEYRNCDLPSWGLNCAE